MSLRAPRELAVTSWATDAAPVSEAGPHGCGSTFVLTPLNSHFLSSWTLPPAFSAIPSAPKSPLHISAHQNPAQTASLNPDATSGSLKRLLWEQSCLPVCPVAWFLLHDHSLPRFVISHVLISCLLGWEPTEGEDCQSPHLCVPI